MRATLLLVVLGCGGGAAVAEPEPALTAFEPETVETQPFDACGAALTPEPALWDATSEAADAWNRATGCELSVGYTGIPVRLVDELVAPGGAEMCGRTRRRREGEVVVEVTAIEISRDCSMQSTVKRELAHLLGATGSSLLPRHEAGLALIDAASLQLVCESVACTRFEPEVE